jgi:DNA-binding response OmpR family regulator
LVTYVRKTLQQNIPIVILSRVNVEDTILHAFELEANEYILKPVNLEELSNKVKQLLKNK